MAKFARTAAIVVGAAVLVATGVGAIGTLAAGTSLASATVAGLSLGTLQAIGTGAAVVSSLLAKKPPIGSVGGSQTQFRADPQAGIPYVIGETAVAGAIVHQASFGGDDRPYQSFVTVLSGGGPIESLDQFYADKAEVDFSGGAALGAYAGFMWMDTQLGACPEADALTAPYAGLPGWGAASKLSGMAATLWTLKADKDGKKYGAGVPPPLWKGKWVKVYDPRQDSTYPGGSGPCRALDENTYVWAGPASMPAGKNPWLHALTWALGRYQDGKKVLGVGAPISSIDVAAFVEAANIADVNGWTVGGQVLSTDDKYNVMKAMCQAGGGEPMRLGAKISCFVNTPRVSLATITQDDLAAGPISITAMQPRRDRINGVIPRYRSEAHDWEIVAGSAVRSAIALAEDGSERTREIEYPLVQNVDQAAELAMYEVVNSREFGPISLPLKPRWIGYKPGDCLTVMIRDGEDAVLDTQDIIILGRNVDPATGTVTQISRSETPSKHPFALGQTGIAPPTPSLGSKPDLPTAQFQDSVVIPAIAASYTEGLAGNITMAVVGGTTATITIPAHDRIYPTLGRRVGIDAKVFTGLALSTEYYIAYDDEALAGDDGSATAAWIISTAKADGYFSDTNRYRHHITWRKTPAADGTGGEGGGSGPPGSGGWDDNDPNTHIP